MNSTYCIKCRLLGTRCNYNGSVLLMNRTLVYSPPPLPLHLSIIVAKRSAKTSPHRSPSATNGLPEPLNGWRGICLVQFLVSESGWGWTGGQISLLDPKVWGDGFGGGRIRRKGALEHRTRYPVTLQQGERQRERKICTHRVWRPYWNMY